MRTAVPRRAGLCRRGLDAMAKALHRSPQPAGRPDRLIRRGRGRFLVARPGSAITDCERDGSPVIGAVRLGLHVEILGVVISAAPRPSASHAPM
jgi:hypothetical protein